MWPIVVGLFLFSGGTGLFSFCLLDTAHRGFFESFIVIFCGVVLIAWWLEDEIVKPLRKLSTKSAEEKEALQEKKSTHKGIS